MSDGFLEFAKSDNFMKLVYLFVICTVLGLGFLSKGEFVELYKITLAAIPNICS